MPPPQTPIPLSESKSIAGKTKLMSQKEVLTVFSQREPIFFFHHVALLENMVGLD